MRALVLDTKTTGFAEPEVVEAAWLLISGEPKGPIGIEVAMTLCERFRPSSPISIVAKAIHHVMKEDLVECRPSSAFRLPDTTAAFGEPIVYLIGHNIDFDWAVIGKPDMQRIDTLALCRDHFPEVDSHSQSATLYHLDRANAREKVRSAHSALADVRICFEILRHLLDRRPEIAS